MDVQYPITEYEKLLKCESLGFYNCCEVISVFLKDRTNSNIYNFFTIFVFDEQIKPEMTSEYLTSQLITISRRFSMGISHDIYPVEKIVEIFWRLNDLEDKSYVNIGKGDIQVGKLEFVPKVFVQQNSTKEILLNKVLKNNFKNGSYILEFFDVEKNFLSYLDKSSLQKITDNLYKIVPIDLFTISDKIGNFIFQFPSLNTQVNYTTNEQETVLNYNIQIDKRLQNRNQYQLISELIYDDNTTGFGTAICGNSNNDIQIEVGDSSQVCHTTLIDNFSQLILCKQETTFMREISMSMYTNTEFAEQRLIFSKDNKTIADAIDIYSVRKLTIEEPVIRRREKYIEERQYSKRIEELVKRKEFRRYGIKPERKTAINDIRDLLNSAESGKVYLWDPYLCAEDILDTWYYNEVAGVRFYAITSGEMAKKQKVPISQWIAREKRILETRSNNYGIQMEFRCQCNGHGYAFHDRFLMILNKDEKPKVWSLGTSINSLGKKHHIIQEVQHPRMVVDAFDELWNMLESDECLIWKKG